MMKREQKSKFINEAFVAATAGGGAIFSTLEPRDLRMAEVYFQVVEKYETEYQCELAEFRYHSFDEVVDKALAEIDLNQYRELFADERELRISFVRVAFAYNRWCRRNKLPAKEDITRSSQVKIMRLEKKAIKSPEHLQSIFDSQLDPIEKSTADLCCRGAAWLAYAGLTEDEIVEIPVDDFNLPDKSLCVFRAGIPTKIYLPAESIPCFQALATLDHFESYRSIYKGGKTTFKRVDSKSIIRGVDTGRSARTKVKQRDNSSKIVLNNIFTRQKKAGGLELLTYNNLMRNGFFYRAYLEEVARGPGEWYQLGESQLGWEDKRSVKRFRVKELDKLLAFELASVKEMKTKENAGLKERYWRNVIYKEYSLWKQAVGVNGRMEP